MIDIHCHILAGVDDGAESIHESISLARMAKENSIDTIVATSHFVDYYNIDDYVFERDIQIENLNNTLKEKAIDVEILPGAEVHLDNNLFSAGTLDDLTINNSRYMLCEFSLKPFDPNDAIELAEEIISRGHIPIIAHPERYITFFNTPFVVNDLAYMGCLFQVNASSLAGHGGLQMQGFATELITRGFVDFIGTDAHSVGARNNKLLEKIKMFDESITDEQLDWMLYSAPSKVINDKDIIYSDRDYFK